MSKSRAEYREQLVRALRGAFPESYSYVVLRIEDGRVSGFHVGVRRPAEGNSGAVDRAARLELRLLRLAKVDPVIREILDDANRPEAALDEGPWP